MIDVRLFNFIHGFTDKFWLFDWLMTLVARYLGYVLVLGFLALVFWEKKWRPRLYFLFLAAVSLLISRGLITEVIRFFYKRPRPFSALNFTPLIEPLASVSFPSGHAVFFFGLAAVVFYLNRYWSWWFFAAAILMGLARIFVGLHWPTDVLAGALVGILITLATRKFLAHH